MNDDYLWDKTGQPDPQIQQLEEILGTLRYQPKPLELPNDRGLPQRRKYFSLLAIAASVLLAILAGGIWLRVRTKSDVPPQKVQAMAGPAIDEKKISPAATNPVNKPAVNESATASNNRPRKKSSTPAFVRRQREEALMAKEQVMLALRLASEKLSMVQRKTQTTTPANQIKNQHRIG